MDNLEYLMLLKERLMNYKKELSGDLIDFAFGDTIPYSHRTQQGVIEQLSDIFIHAQNKPRKEIERNFLVRYWELAKQRRAINLGTSMACYSASTAIEIIANYLKTFKLRTALIEPTFDNLPAILQRVGVNLVSLAEDDIFPSINYSKLSSLAVDAFFLVLPNNPTGHLLNKGEFTNLVDFCAKNGKLLIVDFCFRLFSKEMYWDQYGAALDSDCKFLFIEDTGKIWPLLDLKTALLTSHPKLYKDVKRIHNEFLLNVSPFVLELIGRCIISVKNEFEFDVVNIIQKNRAYLRSSISNTILRPANLDSQISFEWLEITKDYHAERIWEMLINAGIFVLPGSLFYWGTPMSGQNKLRIALARNPNIFIAGVDSLTKILTSINPSH